MSKEPQALHPPPTSCSCPVPPHSSQAGRLGVEVEGVGRGRVVCVSPKSGSCTDESSLNGEPQAVLSCPALTHLSPRSPNSLT